jgi:glycosyltransferase involved in cell wall biosynthesis
MTKQLLDILMISTSYPANLNDWRGLFIRHLCDALARRSDLKLHLWAPPGEIHPSIRPAVTTIEAAWLTKLMQCGGIAHLLRTKTLSAVTAPLKLLFMLRSVYCRSTDIQLYHVNWLQNALPLPNDGKPLLISVLGTDMQLLDKPLMQSLLRRVFKQHPTIICPNADWMIPKLRKAFADVAEITFLPFGIDPMWYELERQPPPSPPAQWLVVTRLTQAKLGRLFEWCAAMFDKQPRELHLFGPMQEMIDLPPWIHYHGPASPDTLCRDWFPNAQGLITLSQHAEGRPQVMLEAMAAGLPIVASRLAAHEDIVFHGETGWLCENSQDVANAILYCENPDNNQRMGKNARIWVKQAVGTWDDCAERYETHYRQLMMSRHS